MSNESAAEISDATVLYIGYGIVSWPQPDKKRLIATFGDDRAVELEKAVRDLLTEVGRIDINWNKTPSLAEAGEVARDAMREAHPELSPVAIEALVSYFTFSWK